MDKRYFAIRAAQARAWSDRWRTQAWAMRAGTEARNDAIDMAEEWSARADLASAYARRAPSAGTRA